jgi:hypothetical protein
MSNTSVRPALLLIGPKEARREVRHLFAGLKPVEFAQWNGLPAGPAVCVDARRFAWWSPDTFQQLRSALEEGFDVALPASNAAAWPVCGFDAPPAKASKAVLERFAASVVDAVNCPLTVFDVAGAVVDGTVAASFASGSTVSSSCRLPAVFAVADGSKLSSRPRTFGDLEGSFVLVASVWCHDVDPVVLSVAMIARDEEQQIAAAVRSVLDVADEVVVYDTGSSDATVAVAVAAGAVVRQGVWVDDFAAARNEALAMCRGSWVLKLDCDERAEFDVGAADMLRGRLASLSTPGVFEVRLVNVGRDGVRVSSPTWLRRVTHRSMRWQNRVHEVAAFADGTVPPVAERFDGMMLLHAGYGTERAGRDVQNLALARLRFSEDGEALAVFELARASLVNELFHDAAAGFESVAVSAAGSDVGSLATVFLALTYARSGRVSEVMPTLDVLLSGSGAANVAARWVAAGAAQDPVVALELLDGVVDVDFFHVAASSSEVSAFRAFLAACAGDAGRTLVELGVSGCERFEPAWWAASVAAAAGVFAPAELLASRVAAGMAAATGTSDGCVGLREVTVFLAAGPPDGAHEVVSLLVERFGADRHLVAFLVSGSVRGGFLAACDARIRLAELGFLSAGDPLVRLVVDGFGDCGDRFLAALLLDDLSVPAPAGFESWVARVVPEVSDSQVAVVLDAVDVLLPELSETAVAAFADMFS